MCLEGQGDRLSGVCEERSGRFVVVQGLGDVTGTLQWCCVVKCAVS